MKTQEKNITMVRLLLMAVIFFSFQTGTHAQTGKDLYDTGRTLWESGQREESIDFFTRALAAGLNYDEYYRDFYTPGGDIYYLRGTAFLNISKNEEAISDFRIFIDHMLSRNENVWVSKGYVQMANAHQARNDTDAVLDDLNNALIQNSSNINAYRLRGNYYYLSENFAQAYTDYTSACNRAADSGDVGTEGKVSNRREIVLSLYNRSIILHLDGRHKAAFSDLLASAMLDPNDTVTIDKLKSRESSYPWAGDYMSMILNPVTNEDRKKRAEANYSSGRYEYAIADYTYLIVESRINGQSDSVSMYYAYLGRATAYQAISEPDLEDYDNDRALEICPIRPFNPGSMIFEKGALPINARETSNPTPTPGKPSDGTYIDVLESNFIAPASGGTREINAISFSSTGERDSFSFAPDGVITDIVYSDCENPVCIHLKFIGGTLAIDPIEEANSITINGRIAKSIEVLNEPDGSGFTVTFYFPLQTLRNILYTEAWNDDGSVTIDFYLRS